MFAKNATKNFFFVCLESPFIFVNLLKYIWTPKKKGYYNFKCGVRLEKFVFVCVCVKTTIAYNKRMPRQMLFAGGAKTPCTSCGGSFMCAVHCLPHLTSPWWPLHCPSLCELEWRHHGGEAEQNQVAGEGSQQCGGELNGHFSLAHLLSFDNNFWP